MRNRDLNFQILVMKKSFMNFKLKIICECSWFLRIFSNLKLKMLKTKIYGNLKRSYTVQNKLKYVEN